MPRFAFCPAERPFPVPPPPCEWHPPRAAASVEPAAPAFVFPFSSPLVPPCDAYPPQREISRCSSSSMVANPRF